MGVMSVMLECADLPHCKSRLVKTLIKHAPDVGCENDNGAAVLGTALEVASEEEQRALAHAIVDSHQLLEKMSTTRHGQVTVKLALQKVDEAKAHRAAQHLNTCDLRASRYGRAVMADVG